MGAAGDLGPDQGGLAVKHAGVDPLQAVPSVVVVAVAGGGGKVIGADAVFLHGGQDLGLVILRHLVDGPEPVCQSRQHRLASVVHRPADAQALVYGKQIHNNTLFYQNWILNLSSQQALVKKTR